MRVHLGGHLNYYDALERADLEVDLTGRQPLSTVLEALKVPLAEVFLVSINGEAVAVQNAWVEPGDNVEVYPPMGGG
jgi:sulfur carrier protein ThiS